MSFTDKAKNKVEEVVGKVKDRIGGATGDRDLQAEGQADPSKSNLKQAAGGATGDESLKAEGNKDEAKGNLKDAGENVKDAFKA